MRVTKAQASAQAQATREAQERATAQRERILTAGIASIAVIGRRWFDRTYGNTYFSADIVVNGEAVHTISFEYGYGDHYLQSAFEWLDAAGYTSRVRNDNGSSDAPWRYCQEHGIKLVYSAADVARRKDL